MASFAYSAINAHGSVMDGVLSAPDADAAREQLRTKGLLAQRLDQTSDADEAANEGGLGQARQAARRSRSSRASSRR